MKQKLLKKSKGQSVRSQHTVVIIVVTMLVTLTLSTGCDSKSVGNNSPSAPSSNQNSATANFLQLKMFDANNGWATTGDTVIKTTDGGHSWIDVTPTDWETASTPAKATDPTTNPNQGIAATFFLDTKHAWIVSSNARAVAAGPLATMQANPDMFSSGTVTYQPATQDIEIYVRATVDGGNTWMKATTFQVTNPSLIFPPSFINQHEGWLEIATSATTGSNSAATGTFYHTIDGGITWNHQPYQLLQTNPIGPINQNNTTLDNPSGLTVQSGQPCNLANDKTTFPCPSVAATTPSVQGCTKQSSTNSILWATTVNKQNLMVGQSVDSGINWSPAQWQTPGGAPNQNNDSQIVTTPPIMLSDGTGVAPIELEDGPTTNTLPHYYLHLYKIYFDTVLGQFFPRWSDLAATTTFAVPLISGQSNLAVPDLNHIFVVGNDIPQGTSTANNSDKWNLYEFTNNNWQALTSHVASITSTSTTGQSPDVINGSITNLNFISKTEGWATSGPILYHILIDGNNVANWTQVYPAPTTTSGPATAPQLVTRSGGTVINPPANCP